MRCVWVAAMCAAVIWTPSVVAQNPQMEPHEARAIRETLAKPEPPGLIISDAVVGQNLQESAVVNLRGPAPDHDLQVSVASSDAGKLLLTNGRSSAGTPSIVVTVRAGFKVSPQFFLQGVAGDGTATFTASAPGYEQTRATVRLAPAGIVIAGPMKGHNSFQRTAGAAPVKLIVYTARLDSSPEPVPQALAGGLNATFEVTTSNPAAGTIATSPLTISGGDGIATTQFLSAGVGSTTLGIHLLKGPSALSTAAPLSTLTASIRIPSLAVTGGVDIGLNLERAGLLILGQAAPPGGVQVTLTSEDPQALLLAKNAKDTGSKSITLLVPEGTANTPYFLQALAGTGKASYYASATGYTGCTSTVRLTPSGVVLSAPAGLDGPRGFVLSLSAKTTSFAVWTAQLDPVYHSSSDITTQSLRGGLSLVVNLKNSDSTVGTVSSPLTLTGGSEFTNAEFTAKAAGSTQISVVAPEGYTLSGNQSTLRAIVTP